MRNVLVEPAYFTCPDYHKTLGPEVGELAAVANFPPDPEQQLALDAMCAMDKYGKSSAFEVAVICSRQNLKTGLMKIAAIGKTVIMERPLFVWSAHEFRTSQEAFRDMRILIESCPDLDQMVKKINYGNGDEAIEWIGGQRIMFKARTNAGGRGLTGDDVGLDEGFALKPEHMGALLPTLSARPDPQVLYASSAGLAQSDVLRAIRDRGRAGKSRRLAYIEWCAPEGGCKSDGCTHEVGADGCALDDETNWQRSNPALGRRITVEYVRAERQAMPPAEFARERLGWWDEQAGERVISDLDWQNCFNSGSQIVGPPMFALDVAPSRAWAAVAAAGVNESGKSHLEVTGRDRVTDHRTGTEWVVPRLVEMRTAFPDMRVNIAAGSAAEALKPALEAAGIPVDVITVRDVSAACGLFYDHVVTGQVVHLGQPELDAAVAAAKKRVEDGETAWVWGRKRSSADITPLYAETLALWALVGASNLALHPINNVW
jgi:hypothetical protein